MATAPNSSTTAASRPSPTITASIAKSPTRPQAPQPHPYHLYASQNLPRGHHPVTHPNPSSSSPPTHRHHQPQQLATGVLYPVASSGRGFIPRPTRPPDQPRTGAYPPRAATPSMFLMRQHPAATIPAHLHQSHHHHQPQQPFLHVQPSPQRLQHHAVGPGMGSGPINGIPVSSQLKVGPSPSAVSESNGYRNLRDDGREDAVVTIRHRKVRITDGASLYALCRSWLRNGIPEENQSHYGDTIKALPKPLPLPVADSTLPKMEEESEEYEEDEESIAHLSTQDLLKRHIMHAKKVKARLKEGRLKRIARYKTRLALLLPPQVEQFRNDMAAGN